MDVVYGAVRGAESRPLAETRAALLECVAALATGGAEMAGEVERALGDLRHSGVRGAAGVVKEVEKALKRARSVGGARGGSVVVEEMAADAARAAGMPWGTGRPAAMPEGWEDPQGWRCDAGGVWRERPSRQDGAPPEVVRVTHRPIWIARRWVDVDSGAAVVEVVWAQDGGGYGREVVGREVVASARDLVALAGRGAPVSSRSARDVVAWLEASEAVNAGAVALASSISRLGWTEGADGARALQLAGGAPHLLRAEGGHEQTARAVAPAGTWEEWLQAAAVVHRHPVPAILLAASVASVLLEGASAAPFVVDLHGRSSRGKTTALRWAASAWADPTDAGAYILPWSATLAAIEGRAGFLKHLPLLLDDTKKVPAKDRDILAKVVYQWGSGQGKARGAVGGVQRVATWRSVLISTGEAALADIAGHHAGLRLRVLGIDAQPIPDGDAAVQAVEGLQAWGHLGARVGAMAAGRWEEMSQRWVTLRDAAVGRLEAAQGALPGTLPAAARVGGYVASIGLGLEALRALGVPLPDRAALWAVLQRAAVSALASSDTASTAWADVGAWLASHGDRLSDAPGQIGTPPTPHAGWLGRWVDGDVALVPAALSEQLRRLGHDPEEILARWSQEGRIKRGADGRPSRPIRWQGSVVRLVHLVGVMSTPDDSVTVEEGTGGTPSMNVPF